MPKTEGRYEIYSAQELLVKHLANSFFILDSGETQQSINENKFPVVLYKELFL
jgi:hypothetical protein